MKRLGLTLAAALVFSVSMFAEGVQDRRCTGQQCTEMEWFNQQVKAD